MTNTFVAAQFNKNKNVLEKFGLKSLSNSYRGFEYKLALSNGFMFSCLIVILMCRLMCTFKSL